MRILPLSLLFPRSGNEWLVGEKGERARLKASVGGEPDQPPSTGWGFYNWDTEEYKADDTLNCQVYVSASPCCLTVSLSGAAKEAQGQCEGEYNSTGLISSGKQVMSTNPTFLYSFLFVGLQIGWHLRLLSVCETWYIKLVHLAVLEG